MKKVLILGGGGFIGMNLANTLCFEKKYEVTIADCDCHSRLEHFPELRNYTHLHIIEDDFTKPEAYLHLDNNYDELYMMAAIVGVNNTLKHPDTVIRVNTALAHYALEWLQKSKVGKVLFASSSECYAGTTDVFHYTIPTPENVPLCIEDIAHPRFAYAVSKLHGESAFLNCANPMGFECSIVRYQNIFGPCMGFNHVIPHLVQRFESAKTPFKIYGANQTRAFCYISDAVEGTIRVMESPRTNGEIYHIGNSQEITIETLTRAVGKLIGYQGDYIHAPTYPGSVQRRCPDITKARDHVGYDPQVDWADGLKPTVEWYRNFFCSSTLSEGNGFAPPESVGA